MNGASIFLPFLLLTRIATGMDGTLELIHGSRTLYPDDRAHYGIVLHTLEKTDEQLRQHLDEYSHIEKKELINRGIYIRYPNPNHPNEIRCTTLMNELIHEQEERDNALKKITTLLNNGFDPNIICELEVTNNQYPCELGEVLVTISNTPLSDAILMGNIQAVQELLSNHADPNKKDIFDQTALEAVAKLKEYSELSLQPDSTIPIPPVSREIYEQIERKIIEHGHQISGSDESD